MCYSWSLPLAMLLGLVHVAHGDETLCYPTGNCYTIHTDTLSFEKAVITCGPNGYLATMKSQQEKSEILQLVTQLAYKRNISAFWLGLHLKACIVKDKELFGFVWISGDDNTQVSEWGKIPRPSCTSKKRCVILKSKKDHSNNLPGALTWFWRNVECESNNQFICRYNDTIRNSTTAETVVVTDSPTKQYLPYTPSIHQHTTSTSKINLCKGIIAKVTFACGMNVSYGCNGTHCCCGNGITRHYMLKQCRAITNQSCLEQLIGANNISCDCTDKHALCKCSINSGYSQLPVLPSIAVHHPSSSSTPSNADETLLDQLIIPLILALVAFGILIMLVWGGVQMCIRKKKPKRRKSIAPAPPEGNETDSTDHSSSDEDEEEDEDEDEDDDEEKGERQDRTENP